VKLLVPTAEDMRLLGVRLADLVRAGDLLLLTGDLGAGKTTLTQGIAAGLGTPGPVLSPTFVVARLHRGGRLPLLHVDAYRLADLSEVDDLDLDADVAESVTVVEWGAGRAEQLTEHRLELRIERRDEDEVRTVTVVPAGERWAGITLTDLVVAAAAVGDASG
jgi:tRNA threonylcarbamoyladenosine biosynthesis protein TsaE